jgi:hypothetical protein
MAEPAADRSQSRGTLSPMVASRLAVVLVLTSGCPVLNPAWDGLASESDASSSSEGMTGGVPTSNRCLPLPAPPSGATIVAVDPASASELDELIAGAAADTTFVFADGNYPRSGQPTIVISAAGVVLRSASGVPESVILDGGGDSTDLLTIRADDVTVAELSLRNSGDDLLAIDPVGTAGLLRPRIHRVSFRDAVNFQLVAEADFAAGAFVDEGEVSCSNFGITDGFRETTSDCSGVAAIKGFAASRWTVRDSFFEDIWCPESRTFVAVHFGYGAHDTVIERNRFRDAYRGTMLGFETDSLGARPPPEGSTCPPGVQHIGGSIRNNMLWVGGPDLAGAAFPPDALMSLWSACDVDVQHNTLFTLYPVFSTLEHRFTDSSGSIVNNLLSGMVWARDPASIVNAGNLEFSGAELLVDPGTGDLHLAGGAAAIDAGVVAGANGVLDDYDGQPRDTAPDVGADELEP